MSRIVLDAVRRGNHWVVPAAPKQPGLAWLPALMSPALLLIAGITHCAWMQWWI